MPYIPPVRDPSILQYILFFLFLPLFIVTGLIQGVISSGPLFLLESLTPKYRCSSLGGAGCSDIGYGLFTYTLFGMLITGYLFIRVLKFKRKVLWLLSIYIGMLLGGFIYYIITLVNPAPLF